MKRPRPDDLDDNPEAERESRPQAVRRRHHALVHRQPGADDFCRHPQDDVLIDHQLHKTICVALYGAGFSSVTRHALSSFHDVVQEYMRHFALRVHQSMRSCRRSCPTPQDFVFALAQFDLTASSFIPDLSLNPPPTISQAPIFPSAKDKLPSLFEAIDFVPRSELSESSLDRKPYIPSHFPGFPSKHAYTSTPVFASRETDALKIRERSTQEGSQAEHALRNLIAASKASDKRQRQVAGKSRDDAHAQSEQVWRQALDAMADEEGASTAADNQDSILTSFDGAADTRDDDNIGPLDNAVGKFANYDRLFWRKAHKPELMRAG